MHIILVKFTLYVRRFVSRKNDVKVKKYSKLLPDSGILESIPLNGW